VTLTIGRIGLDGSLGEPSSLTYVGDQVTLAGTAKGLSSSQWQALRDQFRGLINPDGVVVPITSVNDSSINGFYSVDSVSPPPMDPNGQYGGWFNWQVQATRIPDSQMPGVELDLWGGFLTGNGIGAAKTDAIPWVAFSDKALDLALDSTIWTSQGSKTLGDGSNLSTFTTSVDGFQHARVPFAVRPESWYLGSCQMEWSYDGGATWTPLTSRQLPNTYQGGAHPAAMWRMTNQNIRVTQHGGAGNPQIDLQFFVGSWSAHTKTINLLHSNPATGTLFDVITSLSVTRYTPEILALRLGVASQTGSPNFTQHAYSIDLVLRRGAAFLEVGFQQVIPNLSDTIGLSLATTETSTTISALPAGVHSGVTASSFDSDGNYYIIASSDSVSTDTTHCGISKALAGGATLEHVQMLVGYTTPASTAAPLGAMLGDFHAETRFVGRL